MKQRIYLACLMAVVLILILPLGIFAQTVVDANLQYSNWIGPPARHSFSGGGYQYVLYTDDINQDNQDLYYRSAPYGGAFGNATLVKADITRQWWDLDFDGSYVHVVYTIAASGNETYRRGTVSAGVITFDSEQNLGDIGVYPHICVSSTGSTFISYNSSWNKVKVKKNANTNGTWSTEWTSSELQGTAIITVSSLVALSGGKIALFLLRSQNTSLVRVWGLGDADNWTAAVSLGVTQYYSTFLSAVADGDDLDIVVSSYDSDITYIRYDYSLQTVSAGEVLSYDTARLDRVCIQRDDEGNIYVYYLIAATDDVMVRVKSSVGGSWSAASVVVDETIIDGLLATGENINCDKDVGNEPGSVYYMANTYKLKSFVFEGADPILPVGVTLAVTDITAETATVSGLVISDGNYEEFCTGSLTWGTAVEPYVWHSYTYAGNVSTDQVLETEAADLYPETLYYVWLVLENEIGIAYAGPEYFTTGVALAYSAPHVTTVGASEYVTPVDVTVLFSGRMSYDGGLDSIGGIQYKVTGTANWITVENSGVIESGTGYNVVILHLLKGTSYDYRAEGRNYLGSGYGVTMVHITGGVYMPGVTPGPGIDLPEWIFPFTLSGTMKTILGIIITVAGMILIAALIRSTGGMLAAAAWGLGLTMVFVVIGWYPLWIILLIGAIVGLLTFLIILGGRK